MSADLMELLASTAVLPSDPVDVDAVVARAEQHRLRTRVAGAMTAATLAVGVTVLGATLASSGPTVPDLVDVPEGVVDRPVVVEPREGAGDAGAKVDEDGPILAPEAEGQAASDHGAGEGEADSDAIPPPPEPIEEREYVAFADDDGVYRFGFESGPMGWSEFDPGANVGQVWMRDGTAHTGDHAFGAFRPEPARAARTNGGVTTASVRIASPALTIPEAATAVEVEFWYRWNQVPSDDSFSLVVNSTTSRCSEVYAETYEGRPTGPYGVRPDGTCGPDLHESLTRSETWQKVTVVLPFESVDLEDPSVRVAVSASSSRTEEPCEGEPGNPDCSRGFWFDDVTVRFITDEG